MHFNLRLPLDVNLVASDAPRRVRIGACHHAGELLRHRGGEENSSASSLKRSYVNAQFELALPLWNVERRERARVGMVCIVGNSDHLVIRPNIVDVRDKETT